MLTLSFTLPAVFQQIHACSDMSIFKKILRRKSTVSEREDIPDLPKEQSKEREINTKERCLDRTKRSRRKHNDLTYKPFLLETVSSAESVEVASNSDVELTSGEVSCSASNTEDEILDNFIDKQSRKLSVKLQKLK